MSNIEPDRMWRKFSMNRRWTLNVLQGYCVHEIFWKLVYCIFISRTGEEFDTQIGTSGSRSSLVKKLHEV